MDKKKIKSMPPEELRGFEEFIDSQPADTQFLPRPVAASNKKETTFENLTFITNDNLRLTKLKNLLANQVGFVEKFTQGEGLIREQQKEIKKSKAELFKICDLPGSPYRKSLRDIFDPFFDPPEINS
jgi:hypothetical protein